MLIPLFWADRLLPFSLSLNLLILVAVYFYFKQENAKKQRTEGLLRQQTERERLVTQIAQHIRQSLDLDHVLTTTVAEVQQFLQADRVLIYRLWSDGSGCVINETVLPLYPRVLGQSFPEEVFPQAYHQAYALGKTRAIANVEEANIEDCLVAFVKHFGVKAKLVVPILQENRQAEGHPHIAIPPTLWGLLIAHQCSNPRQWEDWEVELMKQLANQVAIAVQQSELYEQLQQLNTQLEHRVQHRTEELANTNATLQAEIAERQRTEAALCHTNYTLQALIAASPRAIFTLDLNDTVQNLEPDRRTKCLAGLSKRRSVSPTLFFKTTQNIAPCGRAS
ncbi:MAG: GAF domain-containing protein [Acaryochloridaceae cyanobacterium RU_4_10]|nr:GAF domain-containing protein [Acaryochloridaceae cyanobacterium RU_4_10]